MLKSDYNYSNTGWNLNLWYNCGFDRCSPLLTSQALEISQNFKNNQLNSAISERGPLIISTPASC